VTRMTVVADRELCVGAGRCALTAPAVFTSDDDGLVAVREPQVTDDHRAAVTTAVSLCPAQALRIDPPTSA